jgi:acyl-CoA thioester hydrolase
VVANSSELNGGKALLQASVDVEVPFQDLDPMQVVWHGNYFRYFEQARAALLRKIDYDYPQMEASRYMWPIVDTRVKFVRPLRYGQRVRVTARLTEWENRLRIDYEIVDAVSGERMTRAHTVQCAVCAETLELQFVSPEPLRSRLRGLSEGSES